MLEEVAGYLGTQVVTAHARTLVGLSMVCDEFAQHGEDEYSFRGFVVAEFVVSVDDVPARDGLALASDVVGSAEAAIAPTDDDVWILHCEERGLTTGQSTMPTARRDRVKSGLCPAVVMAHPDRYA